MLFRSHGWIVVAALSVWLLTGCASSSTNSKASAQAQDMSDSEEEEEVDYSPAAVAARTESHARYASAVIHDLNDEIEEAAADFSAAALADLANEPMVLEVSGRLLRLKKNDAVLEILRKATERRGASGDLFARMGLVYAMQGRTEEAMAANQQAIARSPGSLAGYQQLAQIHLQKRQFEEGLKVLDQAAKKRDADAGYLADLSELFTAFARAGQGDAAKPRALEALNRAAALKPTNPVLLQKLADGFEYLGDAKQAAEYYLKLQERFPHYPGIREKLIQLFVGTQDRKRAMEQLESIVRDAPTNPKAYYWLGSLAFEEKKNQEAVDYLNKAILLDANFEPAYYDLAAAQINLSRTNEALVTLGKARARFKQSFVGEYYTGLTYNRMRDYSNAVVHFTACEIIARATETNRLTHTFYFQLGAAHERFHRYEEAEKYFKMSLALAPDFSEALNYLGYMWAERGERLPEALKMIEKAVKLEPKNAAFLDSLGWVLFKLGQPREGLKHVLKSIELNDEPDATLYDHLGDIYSALHEPRKAREAWEKALTIEPNEHREEIRKKLEAAPSSDRPAR